jgi:hypothetical protein
MRTAFPRVKINNLLTLFVVYFWITQLFFEPDPDSLNKYLLIVPSLLLSGLIIYLLIEGDDFKYKTTTYLIYIFIIGSIFTCIFNKEIELFFATLIFATPIIIANEKSSILDTKTVNILFIMTIIVGIITFHLNINEYGYLPGHSALRGNTPWWRVSIFPISTPTYTGIFSLFVFVYNLGKKSISSKAIKIVSLYFLLLSGSRTVMLLFGAIVLYKLLVNTKILKYLLPYLIIILPILVLNTGLIHDISKSDFGQEYILRGKKISEDKIKNKPRTVLFNNLLELYSEKPILGHGSYNYSDRFPDSRARSENKWMSLFASNGIFAILLFVFFSIKYFQSAYHKENYKAIGALIIIVTMFYYGSFYNAYNVIYLINVFLLSKKNNNVY